MSATRLQCGKAFDGETPDLLDDVEILIRDGKIVELAATVDRPAGPSGWARGVWSTPT